MGSKSSCGCSKAVILYKMSNEIAISVPSIREELINEAVKFLANPRIIGFPIDEKDKYLRSRGLTDAEISAALERCSSIIQNSKSALSSVQNPNSSRSILRVVGTVALASGFCYGLYHLLMKYVVPFLFRRPKKPDPAVELKRINDSVGYLRAEVQKIQTDLEKVVIVQTEQHTAVRALGDIKTELATVKGILLSRHQFPSVPLTGSTSIPAWQMASCADSADRSSVPESNGGSQGSDSSLEMIKEAELAEAVSQNQ